MTETLLKPYTREEIASIINNHAGEISANIAIDFYQLAENVGGIEWLNEIADSKITGDLPVLLENIGYTPVAVTPTEVIIKVTGQIVSIEP